MRSPLETVFDQTLGSCFASALKDMLGPAVSESIYGLLERNGVPRQEISNRFDNTVAVLMKALGGASRVLVHRTVLGMYQQYSQRADFSYQDSLREKLTVLKEAVVASHLVPKSQRQGIDLDSVVMMRIGNPNEPRSASG